MSPFYHFHIFSFLLGFISEFNKFLILAYNHLINIHLTIPRKIPKLAQLYPEYIIIFIIKIVGYFWGVIAKHYGHLYTLSQKRNLFVKRGVLFVGALDVTPLLPSNL